MTKHPSRTSGTYEPGDGQSVGRRGLWANSDRGTRGVRSGNRKRVLEVLRRGTILRPEAGVGKETDLEMSRNASEKKFN